MYSRFFLRTLRMRSGWRLENKQDKKVESGMNDHIDVY